MTLPFRRGRAGAIRIAGTAHAAIAALFLAALLTGCGAGSATTTPAGGLVTVSVTPPTATTRVGGVSVAFSAAVSNATNASVQWQVDGVSGGNATVGTISAAGVYSSPASPPAQPTVTVTAVSVEDSTKSGSASVTLISDAMGPPTIGGTPATSATVGQAYSFTPTASSPRGATLTFAIANKPAWASFSASTGQLSGTPAAADAGAYSNVTISVSDGAATASLAPFSITVSMVTVVPPTISGTPPMNATAGQAYSFTPAASSPRGATLTFSIANKPAWAAFSMVTGQLSGTPGAASVGSYSSITISVSDGTATASLAPFTITVSSAAPPTISGTPPTSVTAGQAYSFTPTASSPRGATLTFSIANRPAWAAFSTVTGRLSGTPATTDIGTFANVAISVNDGTATASLAPFTITVQAGTTGSATVTWSPPTTRTDGTPLTNLAGIRIYYGTAQGSYPTQISVTNLGLTSYVVDSLTVGVTYYFVTTAYDAAGIESDYTAVVSKTIQ
jgi:Putative Ig domain